MMAVTSSGWMRAYRVPVLAGLVCVSFSAPVVPDPAKPDVSNRQTLVSQLEPALAAAPQVIHNGLRQDKRLALTFDACSSSQPGKLDDKVISILIEKQVPATLFLGGKWVQDQAARARELAQNPLFEIANHGFHHPHLTRMNARAMEEDLSAAQQVIETVTGVRPRYFRAPYGEYNKEVLQVASRLGLLTIQYDLASGDPDRRISASRLSRYVIQNVKGGSIVVMHVNQRGWHTAEALPAIIRSLRARGFEFVTISQLLNEAPRTSDLLAQHVN